MSIQTNKGMATSASLCKGPIFYYYAKSQSFPSIPFIFAQKQHHYSSAENSVSPGLVSFKSCKLGSKTRGKVDTLETYQRRRTAAPRGVLSARMDPPGQGGPPGGRGGGGDGGSRRRRASQRTAAAGVFGGSCYDGSRANLRCWVAPRD